MSSYKFRHVGPGKAARDRANEDFDLKDDEFFGEETAALYFPSSSDFILQMNHFGPRGSSIEQYIRALFLDLGTKQKFNFSIVRLSAIMRSDQATLYRNMQLLKAIEFKMYVPGALQVPQAKRQSVSSILSDDVVSSAQDVTIKIQAQRSGALNESRVRSLIQDLLGMGESITRLTVKGAESSDETAVLLDLLECQLMTEKQILATSKKRHALNERWKILRSAYDEWKSDGHL